MIVQKTPYVEVAVTRPVFKTLTYAVPPALSTEATIGKRVQVPVRGHKVTGYILDTLEETDHKEVKALLHVLDTEPLFPPSMVPFFRWIADYYLYPIGEVIKGALPTGINATHVQWVRITDKGDRHLRENRADDDSAILAILGPQGEMTERALSKALGKKIPPERLKQLERRKWITRENRVKAGRVRPRKERFVALPIVPPHMNGLSAAREKVLALVEKRGELAVSVLRREIPTAGPLVNKMVQSGLLDLREKEVYRDPFGEPIDQDLSPPLLTKDQAEVVSEVIKSLGKGFKPYLLHGITGSGKTEVYMQAAATTLKRNDQVLVLVPEIGLISQTERRFRARFGETVSLLHSGLSQGERFDQWMRIVRGNAAIAIGARSAIFAPFDRLGLIIVDEEHDDSYKQESRLRYHARDLAVVRAKIEGAVALLGSATPSLQSYYNVQNKRYRGLHLKKRVQNNPLPEVTVLDLREAEGYKRTKPLITPELKKAMEETLGRDEQTLLFLNRRGFASYPTCTGCGATIRCKNCDVTMTLHQGAHAFRCHYCGYHLPKTIGCPACGNAKFKHLGLGTEKLEAKITEMFPDAHVARMDRDTTARKGALIKILKDLRQGAIDILIGTQMVAKGHHYPNITLVGILCADLSLNFPDFRAGERTFQLLAQVAGRAGRGTTPGRVILQSFNPEHFCMTTAADQAYDTFYQHEIGFRKSLRYPPFSRLVQILLAGKDIEETSRFAHSVGVLCHELRRANGVFGNEVQVLGPVPAPLSRIKNTYRWLLLLKGKRVNSLHQFAREAWAKAERISRSKGTTIAINVDPVDML